MLVTNDHRSLHTTEPTPTTNLNPADPLEAALVAHYEALITISDLIPYEN